MELFLDIKLNRRLRDTLNEQHNFMFDKIAEFKVPGKGNSEKKTGAFNCICSCLDRIDNLVEHCNDIGKNIEDVFGLCDILNYGQTLIDCISMIAKIYGMQYDFKNDTSCFHKSGLDGKGNDEKYFKYIRSLCSVHPVETSYHPSYQGKEPEWCPWISKVSSQWDIQGGDNQRATNADFVAIVYRNDSNTNKHVYIFLTQIFLYIEKRYGYIENIIQEVKRQNRKRICELINKRISLPDECKNYDNYLSELEIAMKERCGDSSSWQINKWRTILKSYFRDNTCNEILKLYKAELKKGIEKIHNSLQNMELDYYFDFEAVTYKASYIPSEYNYSLSKLNYLEPNWEDENLDIEGILSRDKYMGDYSRIQEMLEIVAYVQHQDIPPDVSIINKEIDSKY